MHINSHPVSLSTQNPNLELPDLGISALRGHCNQLSLREAIGNLKPLFPGFAQLAKSATFSRSPCKFPCAFRSIRGTAVCVSAGQCRYTRTLQREVPLSQNLGYRSLVHTMAPRFRIRTPAGRRNHRNPKGHATYTLTIETSSFQGDPTSGAICLYSSRPLVVLRHFRRWQRWPTCACGSKSACPCLTLIATTGHRHGIALC